MTFSTSPEIGKIAEALAKAQGKFPVIEKTKEAKLKGTSKSGSSYEYGYKYADIADVLKAILPILAENGLSVIQPTLIESGGIFIRTRLMHSSGEWLESEYPVSSVSGEHQKMGGALTYARRYALCSMLAITADEDVDAGDIEVGAAKKSAPERPYTPPGSAVKPQRTIVQNTPDEDGGLPLPPVLSKKSPEPQKSFVEKAKDKILEAKNTTELEIIWNDDILPRLDGKKPHDINEIKSFYISQKDSLPS